MGRLFQAGHSGGPGRGSGTRNKLNRKFLEDLLGDWEQHGKDAIRLMRIERPGDYVRVVAATLPKELWLEHSTVSDIDDDTLDRMIETLRAQVLEERRPPPMIELNPEKDKDVVESRGAGEAGERKATPRRREQARRL